MPEPSWVFILAMVTLAIALALGLGALYRTRRAVKDGETSAVPREEIEQARARKAEGLDGADGQDRQA